MNDLIYAILLSFLPVSELRGGIPYAISQGVNPFLAYFACVVANILIIFPVFFFLDFLHEHFMKIKPYRLLFEVYIARVQRKLDKMLHLWEYLILFLFVAVPMPGTGAYTGCLVAWLLKMKRVKSIFAIMIAVMCAGVVVTLASLSFFSLF